MLQLNNKTTETYKHFIFDFDGVISDSFEISCEEINRIASENFPSIPHASTKEDVVYIYSGPLKTSLRRFGLKDDAASDFFDRHSAAMQKRAKEINPFAAVIDIIAETIPGKSSIVTSSYSQAVKTILSKSTNYTDSLFQFICGREQKLTKTKKINNILQAMNLSHNQALHIVDMASDVLYSREVPISCCVVGWGYHPISYLKVFEPTYAVNTPQELKDLINRIK
jgi:phosphoglycolate phosphatase-like HAD superfamily hydrolase